MLTVIALEDGGKAVDASERERRVGKSRIPDVCRLNCQGSCAGTNCFDLRDIVDGKIVVKEELLPMLWSASRKTQLIRRVAIPLGFGNNIRG